MPVHIPLSSTPPLFVSLLHWKAKKDPQCLACPGGDEVGQAGPDEERQGRGRGRKGHVSMPRISSSRLTPRAFARRAATSARGRIPLALCSQLRRLPTGTSAASASSF